ncbi:MAG: hypothetical protein IT435_05530 [Phycisphaerales bacterium]|nr:hypothetical protein [Phycisphaerales bacterium]
MSEVDPAILLERLQAVADAELVTVREHRRRGAGVSPLMQKAALLVMLAHEGELLSNRGLADRMGVGIEAAVTVIQALYRQGFIVIRGESRTRRRFIVAGKALTSQATATPCWTKGGPGPDTFRRRQYYLTARRKRALAAEACSPEERAMTSDEAAAVLYSAMRELGIDPDEKARIRGDGRGRGETQLRDRLVLYLRDVKAMSWPAIAFAIRGDPKKHVTCLTAYGRLKRRIPDEGNAAGGEAT